MNPPPTPAGWYPDGNVLRYWDGRTWTSQTAPLGPPVAPQAPSAATPQDGPIQEHPEPRNSWLRKRVLVPTGAVALLFLLGLIGSHSGGSASVSVADPVPLAGGLSSPSTGAQASDVAAAQKAAADKAAADKAAADKAAAEKAAQAKAAAQKAAAQAKAAQQAAAAKAAAQRAAADKAAAQAKAAQQAAAQQAAAQQAAAAAAASSLDPRFGTCTEAKAAGYGPYRQGVDPEYDWYRDADHDGIDCEP